MCLTRDNLHGWICPLIFGAPDFLNIPMFRTVSKIKTPRRSKIWQNFLHIPYPSHTMSLIYNIYFLINVFEFKVPHDGLSGSDTLPNGFRSYQPESLRKVHTLHCLLRIIILKNQKFFSHSKVNMTSHHVNLNYLNWNPISKRQKVSSP